MECHLSRDLIQFKSQLELFRTFRDNTAPVCRQLITDYNIINLAPLQSKHHQGSSTTEQHQMATRVAGYQGCAQDTRHTHTSSSSVHAHNNDEVSQTTPQFMVPGVTKERLLGDESVGSSTRAVTNIFRSVLCCWSFCILVSFV